MKSMAFSVTLFTFLLVGCVDDPKLAKVEQSLAQLEQKVAKLETDKSELQGTLNDLSLKYLLNAEMRDFAYLTPGAAGYSVVRFDLGMLTVAIEDIQPYANGSKVKLKFGNPLGAVVNGLNMEVEWGQVDDKGFPKNETTKQKQVELNELLRSSSWTFATVIVENSPPNQLGFVRLRKLSHKGIRLSAAS